MVCRKREKNRESSTEMAMTVMSIDNHNNDAIGAASGKTNPVINTQNNNEYVFSKFDPPSLGVNGAAGGDYEPSAMYDSLLDNDAAGPVDPQKK